MKKLNSVVLLPALSLVLFVLFQEPINDLLSKTIVNTVLSKIQFIGHPIRQVAFAVLFAMLIAYVVIKWRDGFKYSVLRLAWIVAFTLAYLYARTGSAWHFTDWLSFNGSGIKASDVLVILSFSSFLILFLKERIFIHKAPHLTEQGFETDSPIILEEDDANKRWRYINTIATLLLRANTNERAFALGIAGEWGSGKTSFMNTLERHFSREKNLLQLHFNPWLISEAKGITEAFFNELSFQLSLKTDMLTGDLSEYIRAITGQKEGNPIVRILRKAWPGFRWERNGIEELRTNINHSLRQIGKKIIIYIDDLDRLDDEEITEVLRIIRNSADFANLIFVVAYDKTQINTALSEKFRHGSTRFVEKVFQHEFHLPPADQVLLLEELNTRLTPLFSGYDAQAFKAMFEYEGFKYTYSSLKKYLRHYRDVSRYVNLFKVHYRFLQNHVFLPDLYLILFLRLKYPSVASMLYADRASLLTNFGGMRLIDKTDPKSNLIELIMASENGTETILEQRIRDAKWGFDTEQRREVMSIAQSLFRSEGDLAFLSQNDVPDAAYTIRDPDYFDRYFDEDLNSRLSNIEFQEAFSQPKPVFLKQVEAWMQDAQMGRDLIKTLERRTQFNNKEDFDKVLSALALIDDFPGEENKLPLYGRIDEREFLGRIAYERTNINPSTTARLFGGFEAFQDYVRSFLKEDLTFYSLRYRIAAQMAKGGLREHATLPAEEVRAVIKTEVFDKMLLEDSGVENLLAVYGLLEGSAEEEEREEMKKEIRHFILTKDVEGFMKWVPKPCMWGSGGYTIEDWADTYFGDSIDDFVAQLDLDNLSDAGKEGIEFIKKQRARKSSGACVDFDFKALKVRNLNGGWG